MFLSLLWFKEELSSFFLITYDINGYSELFSLLRECLQVKELPKTFWIEELQSIEIVALPDFFFPQ